MNDNETLPQTSLKALQDNKKDRNFKQRELKELQTIEAFKSGSPLAYEMPIRSIETMLHDPFHEKRFSEKGLYNPLMLENEIKILDKKKGGDMWLTGERLHYINSRKLYKKEFGCETFQEYYRTHLDMGKTTVYRSMFVFDNFSYDQSIQLGSKLYLLYDVKGPFSDTEKKTAYNIIANPDVSYREAQNKIGEMKSEIIDAQFSEADAADTTLIKEISNIDLEDIQADTADESQAVNKETAERMAPAMFDDDDTDTEAGTEEPLPHVYIEVSPPEKYIRATAKPTGTIDLDKNDKTYLKNGQFPVVVPWDNEITQKYFHHVLQEKEKTVLNWIKDELSKPENAGDLKKLQKWENRIRKK